MIIDSRTVEHNVTIESEICIVGAGAAGITIAREFLDSDPRVSLIESGGLDYDEETQAIYKGDNIGREYYDLDVSRLRFFGGTTNHWAGWCTPLTTVDFNPRSWIPDSGWPFGLTEMERYYRRAETICEIESFDRDIHHWEQRSAAAQLPLDKASFRTKIYQLSPPTLFGQKYRQELSISQNINVFLKANLLEIELSDLASEVTSLLVTTLEGKTQRHRAKVYVLCCGGIENPRLLLLSNGVQEAGIGNHYGNVGRYFMEHPRFHSGVVMLSDPHINMDLYDNTRDTTFVGALSASEAIQRREHLSNGSLLLEPSWGDHDPSKIHEEAKGVRSLKYLLGHDVKTEEQDDLFDHIRNIISDADDIYDIFFAIIFGRRSYERSNEITHIDVKCVWEQTPNRESRVSLANDRDQFGQNKVRLKWSLSPIDKESVLRTHELLAAELGRTGIGRLRIDLADDNSTWPRGLGGGRHHMGTTRMHRDPKKGVVDENCRVYGVSNLFIAGSSVFPTGGADTPTITIVALALKLADHLKEQMA